jgi:hypothetical protein
MLFLSRKGLVEEMKTELEKAKQKIKHLEGELFVRDRMLDSFTLRNGKLRNAVLELCDRVSKRKWSSEWPLERFEEALRYLRTVAVE